MSSLIFRKVQSFLYSFLPIKTIPLTLLLFGHYHHVENTKSFEIIAKLYCFVVSLVFPLIPLYYISNIRYVVGLSLQYSMGIWVTLFVESKCYMQYYSAVKLTDQATGLNKGLITSNRIYAVFFLIAFIRTILHILRCRDPTSIVFYSFTFIHTSVDFSRLTRIVILDIFYGRMKLLRRSIENIFNSTDHEITVNDQITKIRANMNIYQQRLDDFQLINKRLQATFFTALAACIIYDIIEAHAELISILTGTMEVSVKLPIALLEVAYITLLICGPALFAELASHEVEKIRLVLTFQLQRANDEGLRAALSAGARYLQTRPFQFRLARVAPVDSSLLVSYTNLLFTYMFVVLQWKRNV